MLGSRVSDNITWSRCCHRIRSPGSDATPPSTSDETFSIRACLLPAVTSLQHRTTGNFPMSR